MWYFCFSEKGSLAYLEKDTKVLSALYPSMIEVDIVFCKFLVAVENDHWSRWRWRRLELGRRLQRRKSQVCSGHWLLLFHSIENNSNNNNKLILTKMSPGVMKADWVLVLQGFSNNFYLDDIEWWTKWTPSPFSYSVSMPGECLGCRTCLLDQTQISSKSKSIFFLKCKKSHV